MKWDAEVSAAVNAARRLYGVSLEPALVHAVIEKESLHGRLDITGTLEPNGHYSYGPMQVQDSTASLHGVSEPSTLAIPSLGIRIGTFELARLVRLFPGDIAAAVSGYNAGSGNAVRRAGRFPNQSYVDAVLGFWRRYRGGVAVGAGAVVGLAAVAALVLLVGSRRPAHAGASW